MAKRRRPPVVVEEDTNPDNSHRPPNDNNSNYRSLKSVHPINENQEKYFQAIENNIITVGFGAAGTGKTYVAAYQALKYLWSKKKTNIERIIITRPVVEAGEKLGFLPGDLKEKVDPYLRPIYDALYDIAGVDTVRNKIERDVIEVAPLAFMRGRSIRDAFIILDEAQNASLEQLKMLLTRLGENCKLVIAGDPTQSDLPVRGRQSLFLLEEILTGVPDIAFVKFSSGDIVRSTIVKNIVTAFSKYEGKGNDAPKG